MNRQRTRARIAVVLARMREPWAVYETRRLLRLRGGQPWHWTREGGERTVSFYPDGAGARAPHQDARNARARAAFIEFRGEADAERRAAEIAALPAVTWKGRTLRTIRCHGTTGKGPHDVNVPESLLWSLIGLDGFCCVYHPRESQGAK